MRALIPFLNLFRQQAMWMFIGTFLAFLTILAGIGLLSLSGWFISATGFIAISSYAIASQFNYFYPSAGVRSFSLMRILTRYGERVVTHEATFKLLTDIRVCVYNKLTPLAPAHLAQYKSGDLLNRMVNDVNSLDNLYIRVMSPSCVLFLAILVIGIFFSFLNIALALITMGFAFIAGFCIPVIGGKLAAKTAKALAEDSAKLKTSITEHVQYLAELKVFGAEKKHAQLISTQNRQLINTQEKMSRYTGINAGFMTLLLGMTLWCGVWISALLVHQGLLNGAFIALVALGIMGLFEAIMPLPVAYQYLGRTIASAKRLLSIINRRSEIVFAQDSRVNVPLDNGMAFESLSFHYPDRHNVYSNFNLSICPNQKIAIIGPTGCGKSTMISLLARFYQPQEGVIRIGGMDIAQLSEAQLRQQMTIISQHAHIFNGSIRDNLRIADSEATDEGLWHALEVVELKNFVEALPDGLDSWTGEYGKHLSKGQQKRLSLARAVLSKAPILILDEPTEGLDKIIEQKVIHNLQLIMKGKTVILITHNRGLLNGVDRVVKLGSTITP
ncbi:cysteine/glutathione ABC transporter ATP-binding protein/permease CydC [Caedibacter taeniospiralis]|jgi:ATP-binding cassette subfamily C protein CydC|uniref:heme ABC transporter ATP-binding protein/permease CydC n=1 Tax=Caedibacter taeniospiralis TaxID=28907 RepID=UPI0037BE6C46